MFSSGDAPWTEEVEINASRVYELAVQLAGILALLIVVVAVVALFMSPGTFTERQGQLEFAVTETLLPMFELLGAAAAAYLIAPRLCPVFAGLVDRQRICRSGPKRRMTYFSSGAG